MEKENAMSHFNIVRAWKDAEYRRNLSEAERALLPDNPADTIELTDAELGAVNGASNVFSCGAECSEFMPSNVCLPPWQEP
jgi:mersacidin/lichenicidin family type 2 lantibiotic